MISITTLPGRFKLITKSFNELRKVHGLVQAFSVILWGLRNRWYLTDRTLGDEVDRIVGVYLDENIPGVTLMDALRYAAWKVQQLQAVRNAKWETSYRNDPYGSRGGGARNNRADGG